LGEKCVFSAALNLSSLSIGSHRLSGREFQAIGPMTEKVQQSSLPVVAGRVMTVMTGDRGTCV